MLTKQQKEIIIDVLGHTKQVISEHDYKDDLSLIEGKAGAILFYAYLYQTFKKESDREQVFILLEESFSQLESVNMNSSLGSGFTGFAKVIIHLIKLKIITTDSIAILENINGYILKSIEKDIEHKNYDLLYGIVGKGVYFLALHQFCNSETALKHIFDSLLNIAEKEDKDYIWKTIHNESYKSYDLGMAHGVPSILLFLSALYKLNIYPQTIRKILKDQLDWIWSFEKASADFHFAGIFEIKEKKLYSYNARLAWCYGDLGIAFTTWQISRILEDKVYEQKALELVLRCANISLENSTIYHDLAHHYYDTNFCHGTAGVAYFFYLFYQHFMKHASFKKAFHYWLNLTLKAQKSQKQNFLYPTFSTEKQAFIWEEKLDLLEGSLGTALCLMGFLNKKSISWGSIFLLT